MNYNELIKEATYMERIAFKEQIESALDVLDAIIGFPNVDISNVIEEKQKHSQNLEQLKQEYPEYFI